MDASGSKLTSLLIVLSYDYIPVHNCMGYNILTLDALCQYIYPSSSRSKKSPVGGAG